MSRTDTTYNEVPKLKFPVLDTATISSGAPVAYDGTSVVAASEYTWAGSGAATRAAFKPQFAGMASDYATSGKTDAREDFAVDRIVVRRMSCDAATFEIGDLVGPADDGAALLDDKVVAAPAAEATGRVVERHATNTTDVLVEFVSTLSPTGPIA